MKIIIELTDTFGGEANYGWMRHQSIEIPDGTNVVRAAKAVMGYTGVRCKTTDHGDMIELRPYGICQVMFITFFN